MDDLGSLTSDSLRESCIKSVEELNKDVFKTLQSVSTDSLILFLITSSLKPLLNSYQQSSISIDKLIRTIWPTEFAVFERFLKDRKFDTNSLSSSIQLLLDQDDASRHLFETLLIFANAIPLIEEQFHNQEWVLHQLRKELNKWHRAGFFQRLDVSIPSEQLAAPPASRGDLQIQVMTSKPTCVAGEEFSVFVVINNPFDIPIILYSVETQIPIELIDVAGQQRYFALLSEDPSFKRKKDSLWNDIQGLTWDRLRMKLRIKTMPENRIARAVTATELDHQQQTAANQNIYINHAHSERDMHLITNFQPIDITMDSVSPKHLDNALWRLEAFKKGSVPVVLQPGDSVVHQFILCTKSWLLFTPLAHTLQIQVRYAVDERDHLDAVRFELTIRAAITATMVGAIIGGTVGAVARLFSNVGVNVANINAQLFSLPHIISILLAVILSAVTVVSFARKSGVQQIVSIEDFWGGLFLGFLIGFLGQNFALGLIKPGSGS